MHVYPEKFNLTWIFSAFDCGFLNVRFCHVHNDFDHLHYAEFVVSVKKGSVRGGDVAAMKRCKSENSFYVDFGLDSPDQCLGLDSPDQCLDLDQFYGKNPIFDDCSYDLKNDGRSPTGFGRP